MVYMPLSYLYGKRFVGPITPLVLQLREELFLQPYNEINWKKVRHQIISRLILDLITNILIRNRAKSYSMKILI